MVGRPPAESVHVSYQLRVAAGRDEILGWRLGIPATVFPKITFAEAIVKSDALGLAYIEGFDTQSVSPEISKNLDYNLSADEITAVKNKLRSVTLRMPVYHIDSMPADETSRRKVLTFTKGLGAETIVANPDPASLGELDRLATEIGVNLAIETRKDPKGTIGALEGRSKRIGVSADVDAWMQQGIKPLDGLAVIKDRLMLVNLRDRSALGLSGAGVADLPGFFREIYRLQLKPVFFSVEATGAGDPAASLARSIEGFEKAAQPIMADRVGQISRNSPIWTPEKLPGDVKDKIASALPKQALVAPKKHRKLLIMDLCVADLKHSTIPHANYALEMMGKNTGAYEAVFSNDLDNLKYAKIRQYDAVFFNNILGQIFFDEDVKNGLLRFVREGGGVAALHGVTWAGRGWPEFAEMLGAASGPHRVEKGTLKVDDPASPINRGFTTKNFDYTDELYLYYMDGPYSRNKVHVLFSIDTEKTDLSRGPYLRPDNDYGLSWIKNYGKGRVFNTGLGHTPTLFMTPALATHILGAIQFVLGDLEADTTPTGELEARKK